MMPILARQFGCATLLIFLASTACDPTDTDGDGIADRIDNCTLVSNPAQIDADHDGYGNACDPDFDQDGLVAASDRATLEASLGSSDRSTDLDGDGVVDTADLAILDAFLDEPPGPTGVAPAVDLYVSASAPVAGGDGSFANPYRRITDALVRARADRASGAIAPEMPIRIHVAPGTYVGTFFDFFLEGHPEYEQLPIVLDLPRLSLFGSTHLVLDERGLPTGAEPGGTTLRVDVWLLSLQTLVLLTRTSADAIGNEVTLEGFSFEGIQGAQNSASVFVDRVSDFRIRNNLIQHSDYGVVTRLASGTLEGNLLVETGEATAVGGGSLEHPAVVHLVRNRAARNQKHGFMNCPTAPVQFVLDPGTNPPDLAGAISAPLQVTFDRNDPDDFRNLPDTLTVVMIGNDASENGSLGIRLMGNVYPYDYRTADDTQPLTGTLTAILVGNTSVDNGEYGVDIEGGFTERAEPRAFLQNLSAHFLDNSFVGNGRSQALFAFRHWTAAVGYEPLQRFKFAQDSRIEVTDPHGDLAGFDLDHPATDPFDGTVLGNTMTLNDVEVPHGTSITAP
jgi:hypothetical protein